MAYTNFKFVTSPTGTLSGESFIQQTEDAINALGEQVSMTDATEAIEIAQSAQAQATTALSVSQNAQTAANQNASQIVTINANVTSLSAQISNVNSTLGTRITAVESSVSQLQTSTQNSVQFVEQTLVPSQQTQARQNIGAIGSDSPAFTGNATAENLTVSGTLTGTASQAIADQNGNVIDETYAPIDAPSFTGTVQMENLIVTGTITGTAAQAVSDSLGRTISTTYLTNDEAEASYLPLSGGTMTGPLLLAGDPTQELQAATKSYVDAAVAAGGGGGGGTTTEGAVLYTPQSLSSEQQTQAQTNIGGPFLPSSTSAVLYTSQTLETSEQTQARTNIGVNPDGTTIISSGGSILAQDIAIRGNSSDLASARGLLGKLSVLTDSIDLNTVQTQGFYRVRGSTATNSPTTQIEGLIVFAYNNGIITQLVLAVSSGLYFRSLVSGSWTSWDKIYSSSNSTFVDYSVAQSLSTSQQTQALQNIGAIAASGARGVLAGYETTTVSSTAVSVNQNSPDSQQVTAAVQITVADGTAGQSWVKKVSIANAGATVSLGDAWTWAGGGQPPTLTVPALLILSWDNSQGMAFLNT